MDISYYPGCTLKTKAINFEKTALAYLNKLDINAVELKDWNCCGVMFSQSQDNLMKQLAPVRTLIRAKESGNSRLLTLCSMCYNTLKRSALFIQENTDKRDKINDFMDLEETKYYGNEVEVLSILTLLDQVDIDKLKSTIVKDGSSLKVAAYYGCLLTRPKEIAIDRVEDPQIMETLLEAVGCKTAYFPFKTECCGSFQVIGRKDITAERTRKIVDSARKNGAEMIVLACPLCHYNLDKLQKELKERDSSFKTLPVLYITQLLAVLAGIDPGINDFTKHYIDPRPVLERKGLI